MENFIDPKNIKQKISYLREKLNTSSHKYYVLNQPDITDQEYYNNIAKDGWYIQNGFTDLQESGSMYFKEKNGYFNDGHETPAFLIWKGEIGGELIAGPMKESEADKMIAELKSVKKKTKTKKDVVKKAPAKKAPAKKTTKSKKSK